MKNVSLILWKKNIWIFWPTQYCGLLGSLGVARSFYARISVLQWRGWVHRCAQVWVQALPEDCGALSRALHFPDLHCLICGMEMV